MKTAFLDIRAAATLAAIPAVIRIARPAGIVLPFPSPAKVQPLDCSWQRDPDGRLVRRWTTLA